MGPKSSEVELDYKFDARKWYHVALTFSSGSALTPGWARLYVNGVLEASERFKYPKVCPCLSAWVAVTGLELYPQPSVQCPRGDMSALPAMLLPICNHQN